MGARRGAELLALRDLGGGRVASARRLLLFASCVSLGQQ